MVILRLLNAKIWLAINRHAELQQAYHFLLFGGDVGPQSSLNPVVSYRSRYRNPATLKIKFSGDPYCFVSINKVLGGPTYHPIAIRRTGEAITATPADLLTYLLLAGVSHERRPCDRPLAYLHQNRLGNSAASYNFARSSKSRHSTVYKPQSLNLYTCLA